jgi:uncharacterized protein
MILDLKALDELPVSLRLDEDISRLDLLTTGVKPLGLMHLELDIMAGDNVYYCRGRSRCEAELECSRCLDPYRVTLEGEVEFTIRKSGEDTGDASDDDLTDSEMLYPINDEEVDITGPVRESLILAVPMKPLCREDCRGLCPVCGVNRNRKDCDCVVKETDPRWDGLRDLLK